MQWWKRLDGTLEGTADRKPLLSGLPAALRALLPSHSEDTGEATVRAARPALGFYGLGCRQPGLPRGLGLLYAIVAAAGSACRDADKTSSGIQTFLERYALYHLRVRAELRTALLDLLVAVSTQRRAPGSCAESLLRGVLQLSAAHLPLPPIRDLSADPAISRIAAGTQGSRLAVLSGAAFRAPPHTITTPWCGNIAVAFTFAMGDASKGGGSRTTVQVAVKYSSATRKVKLCAHLFVLGPEGVELFQEKAKRWCEGAREATISDAEPGHVGRMQCELVGNWHGDWPMLEDKVTWPSVGVVKKLGNRFTCGLLCEAASLALK